MRKDVWIRDYGQYYPTNGYARPPWEIYDQFLKVVDRPGAILELGCGNGLLQRYLHDLSGLNLTPSGIDRNQFAIEQAQEVVFPDRRDRFVIADLRDGIPFANKFATILANPFYADRGYYEQKDGRIQKLYFDGGIETLIDVCWAALAQVGRLVLWCYDPQLSEISPFVDQFRSVLLSTGKEFREAPSGVVTFWISKPHD